MKKIKSSLVNMVVSLTVITVVAGALLAYVNEATAQQISELKVQNLQKGIKYVLCNENLKVAKTDTIYDENQKDKIQFVVYRAVDKSGKDVGIAISAGAIGFAGPISVLVGFDGDGKILGYTMLETTETPGLGMKAEEWFRKEGKQNIIGLNPAKANLSVSKDGGDIDAITASTITSRAFLTAVKSAYNRFKIENGQEADVQSGASNLKKEKKTEARPEKISKDVSEADKVEKTEAPKENSKSKKAASAEKTKAKKQKNDAVSDAIEKTDAEQATTNKTDAHSGASQQE